MTVEYVASGGYYSHAHAPVYQSTTVPLWFNDHTRSLWNVIPPNSAEIQCVFLWFHFKNLIESFANEDIFLHVYILCWCWIRLLLFIQSLWTNKYWLKRPVYTYIFVKCISKTTSVVWFYGIAILSQLHAVCSGHWSRYSVLCTYYIHVHCTIMT